MDLVGFAGNVGLGLGGYGELDSWNVGLMECWGAEPSRASAVVNNRKCDMHQKPN
jgi:hypothetical protein